MAVLRQQNWLGQLRVDVPHLRALESSIAADFDLAMGRILAGQKPLVIAGFDLNTVGAVGAPAQSLTLNVAGAVILHPLAAEAGTMFSVPAGTAAETLSTTNTNISGSFTPGQVNFLGLDLRRTVDDSTADLCMFLDANSLAENPKTVPLARTLKYKIIVSTVDFGSTPNILPLAKITTDSNNAVTVVQDARPMLYRLGSGGSTPNAQNIYPWPNGRIESGFTGGDKAVSSFKDFADAIMTRLWELGGGEAWFATASDRDVRMVQGQPVVATNGDNFLWDLTGASLGIANTLYWNGISFVFANSTATYNLVTTGNAVLADGSCLYVDLDRTVQGASLTPSTSPLATMGSPSVPGSRFIMAWRRGNEVFIRNAQYETGRALKAASTAAGSSGLGVVRLGSTPGSVSAPAVVPLDANGSLANTATGGNLAAFVGVGNGTGAGVLGTGGVSAGAGVKGIGGSGGHGGDFAGTGAGHGLVAVGGVTNGRGVNGTGGGTGAGVRGSGGGGNAVGVEGFGTGNGAGVTGTGSTTGAGGSFTGGGTSGIGVVGVGGATNGIGGSFTGTGTGAGVVGQGGGSTGAGGSFTGGLTNGVGVISLGAGTGAGITATGGVSGGAGGSFTGGGGNAKGIIALATGNALGADITGSGSGAGANVQGGATNGTGVNATGGGTGTGVVGQGGAGGGIGMEGIGTGGAAGIKATGDSTTTANFKYTATQTKKVYVDPSQFQYDNSGANTQPLWVFGFTADEIRNRTTGDGFRILGRVLVPAGATITSIDFQFTSTDTANINVIISSTLYTPTGTDVSGSNFLNTTAVVPSASSAWYVNAVSQLMPSDGWLTVFILSDPLTDPTKFLKFHGCRVTYTMTTVAPTI